MNDKDLLLDNKLVKSKKDFKPYEAKIFYNALCTYTYNLRQNKIDNRKIIFDTVKIKELMLGGKTNISFYRYKEILKSMNHYITLRESKNEETALMLSIISQIEIKRDKTIFILSQDLCESLKLPEINFTPIKLIELSRLKSSFSIKAYEIISLHRNLENGYYHMPVEKFKWFFNISKGYKSCDMDKRIIKTIEKEINKYTRFTVKITKCKERNKITHYDFHIQEDKLFSSEYEKEIKEIKGLVDKPVKIVDNEKILQSNNEVYKTEKIREDKENNCNKSEYEIHLEWFDTVWKSYPRKEGKHKITKSKTKLKKLYLYKDKVETAVKNYSERVKDTERKFIKMGSTFFNGDYVDFIQVDSQGDQSEYLKNKYGI